MTTSPVLFWCWTAAALVAAALMLPISAADDQFDKDKKACSQQLMTMAPCLTYVGAAAQTPTMDCCADLNKTLSSGVSGKKCLCLLVKYKDEPGIGVKIDAGRALGLPAICHAPANISECPSLLHLAPDSAEAKVFTDFVKGDNGTAPAANVSTATASGGGGPAKGQISTALAVVCGLVAYFILLVSFPMWLNIFSAQCGSFYLI